MVANRSAPTLLVRLRPGQGDDLRVVTDQVRSFKYTDSERKTDLLKLTVDNHTLENHDDPAWRKGTELVVTWGYPGAMAPERTCIITKVTGFQTLTIEARAKSVLMNRVVKNRCFEGKKISEIAADIATENGFGTRQQHIDDSGEVYESVSQSRRTDAQFLRRWASRLGFEFYVDFDGFHFHERRLGQRPIRKFRYHTDPVQGDIIGEPRIENDLTGRPGRSKVKGRNPLTKEDIDASADNDSDKDRSVLAPLVEIVAGDDLIKRPVTEQKLGSEDVVSTADTTNDAAKRRARGRFRRTQQVAIKMRYAIVGDPLLLAKSVVQMEGMGKRLSVRYFVTEVEHELGAPGGYVCNVKQVSDGHGGHSTVSKRARGLEALGFGAPGGRRVTSDDVNRRLLEAVQAANKAGDTDSSDAIRKAISAYSQNPQGAKARVQRTMLAVARNPDASKATRDAAALTVRDLQSNPAETESGGKPNTGEASNDTGALEPLVEIVTNEETGELTRRTSYQQTAGRGNSGR